MQPPVSHCVSGSPHPIPPGRRNLHHPTRPDRAVRRKHSILQRRTRRSSSSGKPSGITKRLEVVQTFQVGTESPSCGGQGVPKQRSREQKRSKVASKLSSPNMADPSPPANGVKAGEADIQTIQTTDAALQIVGTAPKSSSQQRPKSAHCDFRESRRWARSNAEWIDKGDADIQRTLNHRRISEDLLRSLPLPIASLASETEQQSHHRRISSDEESLGQDHNLNCLGRSLSTGNWLNNRRDTAYRKIQIYHQLGRFVRKITDTSNWASKEPTASLNEPEEPKENDSLAQAALKTKPNNPSTRRVAKLSKKPGMDNIRAQKEATDKTQEKSTKLNADAIINLNATEDTPKQLQNIPALREQDIEETKRRSADLREVLSEYQSDRHGNLLPEINMDAIGDISPSAHQNHEQHAASAAAAEPRYSSEQLRSLDSVENSAWKTSNPSSSKSLPNTSLSPPQPGPRISSKHGAANSSPVRCVDGSPLAGRSELSALAQGPHDGSPGSFGIAVVPPETIATKIQALAAHPHEQTKTDTLSAFGALPTKSTDTLTAITFDALGSSRPLTPSNLTDTKSVALKPTMRPTKLHSGFVSSGKTPGEAPNRPLPDLPEVPSPESSEKVRPDAGSRASSQFRRSLLRMSTQPGHRRRTSSLASIASLDEMLQGSSSPHGSPQRRPGSVKQSGSVRSSSQKRSSDLSNPTDATGPDVASVEKSTEVRSPDLGQSHGIAASAPPHDKRDHLSRDQRIHDKRLEDIASARARRVKKTTREGYQSIREEPAAEDFPTPPSSRPPSRATVDRQKSDPISRAPTANISTAYLPKSAGLQRSQAEHIFLAPHTVSLARHVQASHISGATSRTCSVSPVSGPTPMRVSVPISSVIDPTEKCLGPKSKHSHASLHSNATIANSQTVHGTQTPPLSESSTPSSDEDGTGVVGVTTANKTKMQKRLHLSASDLAAMVADIHAMRGQLDAQMRKLQTQSKQIHAIEMQKLRMVDAVNALVAVVSETSTVVPVSSGRHERQAMLTSMNPHLGSYSRKDRDSIASTSNTIVSAVSASSGSGASELTFITEPDPFTNGLESASPLGQESRHFNMDFDRMQELISLDRRQVDSGSNQEGKAKASMSKESGSSVGYVSIDA
jgi:hypothetical protein